METSAMSEKITWTHVDRYVRDAHDSRGMLPMGTTDADCTLSYIKWLERTLARAEQTVMNRDNEIRRTFAELEDVKGRVQKVPGKTKQRLAALELAVGQLVEHSAKPIYGPLGQCKVLGCEAPATTPDGHCDGHFY
jgi:hypothetical protein